MSTAIVSISCKLYRIIPTNYLKLCVPIESKSLLDFSYMADVYES